ncbi:MAG: DNA polymerase III subunit delta' [Senegalia sp. (in: firmicutes)]|uniref:DNA polymerase III subunit delta' n=1 Tax=Senegalia sp. (in: firmicutes) TaxID=1924098 RepID=UPI003F9BDA9A
MDFSDIIGQDRIKNNLKHAIKNYSIAHAYIFEGEAGIGKSMMAQAFSKVLLCKENDSYACGKCSSCIKFDSLNHPDFHVEEKAAKSFKKEQIENIMKEIRTLPYEDGKKIFLIKDADKMTPEAQNAFLKTLEEPPDDTIIILNVENTKSLLPTIISRSQRLKFSPLKSIDIKNYIEEKYNIDSEKSHFIANFSNGNMGRAIDLSDSSDFNNLREELINIINTSIEKENFRVFTQSDFFEENKEDIDLIFNMMITWFRDLLIYKNMKEHELIINSDKKNVLKNQAFKLSNRRIHDIIDDVLQTKDNIMSNVNLKISIELLLLNIGS